MRSPVETRVLENYKGYTAGYPEFQVWGNYVALLEWGCAVIGTKHIITAPLQLSKFRTSIVLDAWCASKSCAHILVTEKSMWVH